MDLSYLHRAASTSTSTNGENEKKDSTMVQSKRARLFKTYERQDFSLPDSIMFYITKNPSTPELYQKMIHTCKDFFVKNPILVISNLDYVLDEWFVNRKPFNMDNLTSKFWATHGFYVKPDDSITNEAVNQSAASLIIPKIFRCDVKSLTLIDQIITFVDLCFLISSAEWIQLSNVTVEENDGTIVGLEKIVEVAVKAKTIKIQHPPITCVTSKTLKELIEIPNFCKLDCFSMFHIPETFDIEAFYVYMKKNKYTSFYLDFNDSISEAYKNRLEEILDEIIATETFDYKVPSITFPGISEEKEYELFLIFLNVVG